MYLFNYIKSEAYINSITTRVREKCGIATRVRHAFIQLHQE